MTTKHVNTFENELSESRSIHDEALRDIKLSKIAERVATAGHFEKALEIIVMIKAEHVRVRTLYHLAQECVMKGRLPMAAEVLNRISSN